MNTNEEPWIFCNRTDNLFIRVNSRSLAVYIRLLDKGT